MIWHRKFRPSPVASYLPCKRNEPVWECILRPKSLNAHRFETNVSPPHQWSTAVSYSFQVPSSLRLSTWSTSSPCSLLSYRCSPSLTLRQSTLGNATSINAPQPLKTALASSVKAFWAISWIPSNASTRPRRSKTPCPRYAFTFR